MIQAVATATPHRARALASLALLSVAVIACSGTQTTPTAASEDPSVPAPSATAPKPATTHEPAVAVDHELTPQDCEEMGAKYRSLTISDQEKKLKQPGLRPEQIEQGEQAIHDAADTLSSKWIEGCKSTNVGQFAPEESLNCAMHATTVAGFDGCLNAAPAPSAAPSASAKPPIKK